jgi:hypothetical protein
MIIIMIIIIEVLTARGLNFDEFKSGGLNKKHAVATWNCEFSLNNVYKSSPYLTGNTLLPHYKAQPVNADWGNSRYFL